MFTHGHKQDHYQKREHRSRWSVENLSCWLLWLQPFNHVCRNKWFNTGENYFAVIHNNINIGSSLFLIFRVILVNCKAARQRFILKRVLALQKWLHAPFPLLCKYVGFIWEPRLNSSSQLRQECYEMLSKHFSHSHTPTGLHRELVKEFEKKCCKMSLYEMLITEAILTYSSCFFYSQLTKHWL